MNTIEEGSVASLEEKIPAGWGDASSCSSTSTKIELCWVPIPRM